MRSRSLPFKSLLIIGCLLTGCLVCGPAIAAEFSADVTQQFSNMRMKGTFYIKGDKIRNEIQMMGTTRVTIVRADKAVVWILMPQMKKYMEMPLEQGVQNNPQFYQDKLEEMAKKEDLGTEKISGYECQKARFIFDDPAQGTMTQWYSKDLDFPLKLVWKGAEGEVATEYTNIKKGGVSDTIFELPEGYSKMDMPAGMPGMMQPGTGGGSPGN